MLSWISFVCQLLLCSVHLLRWYILLLWTWRYLACFLVWGLYSQEKSYILKALRNKFCASFFLVILYKLLGILVCWQQKVDRGGLVHAVGWSDIETVFLGALSVIVTRSVYIRVFLIVVELSGAKGHSVSWSRMSSGEYSEKLGSLESSQWKEEGFLLAVVIMLEIFGFNQEATLSAKIRFMKVICSIRS